MRGSEATFMTCRGGVNFMETYIGAAAASCYPTPLSAHLSAERRVQVLLGVNLRTGESIPGGSCQCTGVW